MKTVSEGKASFYQKLHDSEKVRILILGDHFAESSGLPDGVESWTSILRKELSERYGSEVEIVNLALPEGNDAYSAYVQLENAPKDEPRFSVSAPMMKASASAFAMRDCFGRSA